ncbi:putative Annexin superfamily [Septoria linicola]|nr:putative Annexin superfamily [Septoria linicola]
MSTLKVDDRSRRGRSSSKSGRDRSRSRSHVRAPEVPEPPRAGYVYPPTTSSSVMPGSFGSGPTAGQYDVRAPAQPNGSYYPTTSGPSQYAPPVSAPSHYAPPQGVPYPADDVGFMGGYTDFPPEERPGYVPPHGAYMPPMPRMPSDEDHLAYGSDSSKASAVRGREREPISRNASYGSNAAYRYTPGSGAQSQQYQYGQAPDKLKYTAKLNASQPATYTATPPDQYRSDVKYKNSSASRPYDQLPRTYSDDAYDRDHGAKIVDITPGRGSKSDKKSSASKTQRNSTIDYPPPPPTGLAPQGLGQRMNRLSVSGNRPDMLSLGVGGAVAGAGLPPPSPMLEAYHGTYQSISPMPLAIRPDDDLDLSDLEPLSPPPSRISAGTSRLDSDVSKRDSQGKKRVIMYDPEDDAKKIATALSHRTKIDSDAICDVLPRLSHDQIMEVRKEYKKQVKVQGKGVNMGKHINMKLTGNFGKAVYVCAMGKFESEGYWANFFYQSHGSRRELLIEALMGRSNADIRMIKDEFKDKRYSDDLVKCMEKELKMDKFRSAVLMVLEARRQEEQDVYPAEYVHRDVDMLYRAVQAERGGESAMLEVIVRRSDAHLKEVLRAYERTFGGENFARSALRRSNNLVGEVIAHILNGVINRPARDALLLQHAIKDIADKNRDDELRYELLISRLVRMHWDKTHMMRVKREYYNKYRVTLEDAIEEATRGDFREFMCELCDTKGAK